MMKKDLFSLAVTVFLLLTSIDAQSSTSYNPAAIGKRVFDKPPSLLVAQPEEGAIIFGNKLTVEVIVDNLILTNPDRQGKKQKGEGHLHIWLDEENQTPQNAIWHFTTTELVLSDIPPSEHTLTVEVVNNDHSSFDPPVRKIINVETLTSQSTIDSKQPELPVSPPTDYGTNFQRLFPNIAAIGIAILFILTGFLLWRFG